MVYGAELPVVDLEGGPRSTAVQECLDHIHLYHPHLHVE